MSDFGGLGIVLEENEDLRRQTSNNEGVNNHFLQQSTLPIITSIPQQIVNTHLPEEEIEPVSEQREEVHQQRAETPIRVSSVASLNNLTPKTSSNQMKFNSHISLDSSSNNVQIESTPSVSTSNLEQGLHLPPQEVLLPPLPDAIEDLKSPSTASNPQLHQHTNSNDDKLSNMTLSHKLSQEQTFTTMNNNNNNNNLESSNHSLFSQEFTPIYKNNAASFSNYALDSPTLLIDQEFQLQLQLQQQQQLNHQPQQHQHQHQHQHLNLLKNSHLQHPSLHFFPTLSTSSIKQTDSSHNLSSNSIPTLPALIASFNSNTIANSTNNSSANIGTINATNAGGNTNASSTSNEKTSPLKKLKNLTNGIRKLSLGLSSNTSSSSNVTTPTGSKFPNLNPLAIPPPTTTTGATNTTTNTTPSQFSSTTATAISNTANPTPLRSTLTPLQVDDKTLNLRNGNTTTTYGNPFSNASISHLHLHLQLQLQQPHIQHSSSSSTSTTSSLTSILRAKRARAASQGYHGISPITPPPFSSLPLTSPIITISENLDSNREAMTHMEQSYFDSLNSSVNHTTAHTETSTSPTSTSSTLANNNINLNLNMNMNLSSHHHVNSIEEFTNLDDLLDYSNYLQLQKIQMNDIYVKTREKLEASGWCSTYDLDNLKLQQDASDAQIDTMILKIEEKLNRDFDYSMLNNSRNSMRPRLMREEKSNEMMKKRGFSGSGVVPSRVENGFTCPSLKVLESRCFSFTDF